MVRTAAKAAAVCGAHDERARPITGRAPAHLCRFPDQVVHRRVDEIRELNLGDRPQTAHRQTDGNARNHRFGHWHVDHTLGAEPLEQTFAGAEDAAERRHVLAQQQHAWIARHLFSERFPHRLDDAQVTHTHAR
jgi:hypothetical protein